MRIVHIFRAPVGGLFRHVIDLAGEQAKRGHDVGVFCDSTFAGDRNERLLGELEKKLSLGVARAPMHRNPHWTDAAALKTMGDFCKGVGADVMHGHGSKGGLYARIGAVAARRGAIRTYTPHGGSLNYKPGSPIHRLYMAVERMLERGTDAFLFESRFISDRFHEFVCETDAVTRIVLNGLYRHELEPVAAVEGAVDFLYIGEYRFAKGIDNLLSAMSELAARERLRPTLLLVGQGPDEAALKAQVEVLGLAKQVSFRKPMAAREAFASAHAMIVPSRFESMPYVVIEAAGAAMPMISTDVGGIPEIFGNERHRLIKADDVPGLTDAMASMLRMPNLVRTEDAMRLRDHIAAKFSVEGMTDTVLDAYAEALARRGSGSGASDAIAA
ncbi:MAG: glycosyltransferase family 4 protein [Beijerinckiaceae bacterium]